MDRAVTAFLRALASQLHPERKAAGTAVLSAGQASNR